MEFLMTFFFWAGWAVYAGLAALVLTAIVETVFDRVPYPKRGRLSRLLPVNLLRRLRGGTR